MATINRRSKKCRGGRVIAPNNLPIVCIRHDWTMLENEHADHETYLFPVQVEFADKVPSDLQEWDASYEIHSCALIYHDKCIAVTMYEHCYSMWSLYTGYHRYGKLFDKDWKLTKESLEKIKANSRF